MSLFGTIQRLLPDAAAWRLAAKTSVRKFFEGIAAGALEPARTFLDSSFEDLWPATTRSLAGWEKQFALYGFGSEATRRQVLAATWAAQGGQSPRYIQDVVQAAGFPLYIHEWWSSGPAPYVPRDPRLYTEQPLVGSVQCGEPLAQCGEPDALCNRWLANEPGYLVNLNLTPVAPPPVPDNPATWPYFLFFGGETFGDRVTIDADRRAELEELLLRICPTHLWIVLLVDYVTTSGLSWTLLGDPSTPWTLLGDPSTPWTTL